MSDARITASIVVLTHNRLAALQDCLAAIVQKTRTPYELMVVDNGSSDGSVEWLHGLPTRVELGAMVSFRLFPLPANMGVCARNVAIREARGDFILQVDDDVVVAPGWDASLLAAFEDRTVGAAGELGFFLSWAGFVKPGRTLFLDRRRPTAGEYVDLVMGYCWAWRNLQAEPGLPGPVLLYDEAFNPHWHEETDLQLQIKAAGYRIRCVPPVCRHRSMKSWQGAHNNDPMIGLQHAVAHEELLLKKWGALRGALGLELDRRGQQ